MDKPSEKNKLTLTWILRYIRYIMNNSALMHFKIQTEVPINYVQWKHKSIPPLMYQYSIRIIQAHCRDKLVFPHNLQNKNKLRSF